MKISRILQALVTTLSAGCITAALIIVISFNRPDNTVATGGCTAPDGVCTTATDL